MAEREILVAGFRYDDWANQLWLESILRKGVGAPDRAIFSHILSAGKIWLLRCQGESPIKMPEVAVTAEEIESATFQWITLLSETPVDREIRYRRTTGEELQLSLREIVLHVLNHGTYHRGELRGLCRARGDEDFPETDRYSFTLLQANQ